MREHEHLSYDELIEELRILVRDKHTGIMFIRTESDHSVRIGLAQGRIVSYNYRMHRGPKAISLIRRIQSGEYAFTEEVPGIVSGIISGEAQASDIDFFAELAAIPDRDVFADQDVLFAPPPASAHMQGTAAAEVSPPSASGGPQIGGGELFETVVRELTWYLGPVARVVATEYEQELRSAASREQVHTIVSHLAQEIDDSQQAGEFKTRILGLVAS